MSIAIVSGSGFLGCAVARRLIARGAEPLIIHRGQKNVGIPQGARVALADRMDGAALASIFAANRVIAVVDILCLTLANSLPVLQASVRQGARHVLTSSVDVYANYGGLIRREAPPVRPDPATEDSPLRGFRFPYRGNDRRPQGVDADLLENYDKLPIEEAVRAADTEHVILRPPMIFGPGDPQRRFGWIEAVLAGAGGKTEGDKAEGENPADGPRAGSGTLGKGVVRMDERAMAWLNSYVYLEDAAEGLALAALHPAAAGRTYNLGQQLWRTPVQWLQRIAALNGQDIEVLPAPAGEGLLAERAEAMDLRYPLTLDSARIRAELGFAETVCEDEALRRTLEPPAARAEGG